MLYVRLNGRICSHVLSVYELHLVRLAEVDRVNFIFIYAEMQLVWQYVECHLYLKLKRYAIILIWFSNKPCPLQEIISD